MRRPPIMPNESFGYMTTIAEQSGSLVQCLCICGVEKSVRAKHLRAGLIKSCGCMKAALVRDAKRKHGHTTYEGPPSQTYNSWAGMIQRCTNPANPKFEQYGARGIRVHLRWRLSFAAFLEDMGERPDGTSIDRIDNGGHYEPNNCRWATATQQANNRRPRRHGYTRRKKAA